MLGVRHRPPRQQGGSSHPQDTHTHIPFGVTAAGEFQLFRHLYLFWLQLLLRPRYKLKAASLSTLPEPHLFTSLPWQAWGGCSSPQRSAAEPPLPPRGVPTKAPCSRSLSPVMDGVAGASAGLRLSTARPPGWHRHVARPGDNPRAPLHEGKAPPGSQQRVRGDAGVTEPCRAPWWRPVGSASGSGMTDRQLGGLSSGK